MRQKANGFTIVELLVVIAVIAVLASITVVAYSGVSSRAYDSMVQDDLAGVAKSLEIYKTVTGTYPANQTALEAMTSTVPEARTKVSHDIYDVLAPAVDPTDQNHRNVLICVRAGGTNPAFGIAALSKSGTTWFYTTTGGLVTDSRAWAGQQTVMCPRLGILTTDPLYSRSFGYERASNQPDPLVGWKEWTN